MTLAEHDPTPQESPSSGEKGSAYEHLGKSWALTYKSLRREGVSEESARAITVALVHASGAFA